MRRGRLRAGNLHGKTVRIVGRELGYARIGIRTLRDPFTSKPFVKFYTTKRVGGGVVNFEAGKLLLMST